jgi:hypothetical protein
MSDHPSNHVYPAGGGKFYAFWRGDMIYTPDGHRRYFESEEDAWRFLLQCDEAGGVLG